MRRALIALFVLTLAAFAANIKLYLKDGGFHLVREYQVQTDRVRYYSVERSQWEEMPLDLVDLKRTESETAERQAQLADETKVVAEEEKAVHEARAEVAKIPQDPGVYYVEDNIVKPIKVAESKVHNHKGRTVLQLTPERGIRIVEKITIVQISKEVIEEPIEVQVFRKQMTQDGLYKLWPMKPMDPGEYAVVQFTAGKTNMQVWDFAIKPAGKS